MQALYADVSLKNFVETC